MLYMQRETDSYGTEVVYVGTTPDVVEDGSQVAMIVRKYQDRVATVTVYESDALSSAILWSGEVETLRGAGLLVYRDLPRGEVSVYTQGGSPGDSSVVWLSQSESAVEVTVYKSDCRSGTLLRHRYTPVNSPLPPHIVEMLEGVPREAIERYLDSREG